MLDKPEKTYQLLAALRAAVPFEVELTPSVIAHLRAQQVAVAVNPRQIVTEVSYAGDEGGILCHMAPEESRDALIVSMTTCERSVLCRSPRLCSTTRNIE